MNEWIALLIMASALGMDAFSVALGIGMQGLRLRKVFHIGIVVGLFHAFMPLVGIVTGKLLSTQFEMVTTVIGGGLLLVIGFHMVISSIKVNEQTVRPIGWGLILFATSVSLDSLPIGISLGILGAKALITVALIGIMSVLLTWLGLIMGARFQRYIGSYGELLGGCILIGFGVKLFLPF